MATALWVIYDIVVGIFFVVFLMDRDLTVKEKWVIASLVVVGLGIAVFSGYSDHEASVAQEHNTEQLDRIAGVLAPKTGESTTIGAESLAQAAAAKIDALSNRVEQLQKRTGQRHLTDKQKADLKAAILMSGVILHVFIESPTADPEATTYAREIAKRNK